MQDPFVALLIIVYLCAGYDYADAEILQKISHLSIAADIFI